MVGFPEGFVWWWLGWMTAGVVLILAIWGVGELVVRGRRVRIARSATVEAPGREYPEIPRHPTTLGKVQEKAPVGLGERRHVGIGAADGCQEVFRGDALGSITIAGRISDRLLRLDG